MKDSNDTRSRLIVSAMQLFWEKGYNSTSIADVLQTAKVNSGSGQCAYDVVTEFQGKDGWMPGFKVHMELQPLARPPQ
jgi:hypothetical protein